MLCNNQATFEQIVLKEGVHTTVEPIVHEVTEESLRWEGYKPINPGNQIKDQKTC